MKFEELLSKILEFILFILLSIIFIPSFLIVTNFNAMWKKMLGDLFGLK